MNTLSASWPQRSQPDPWPRAYEWWRLASVGCVLVPWEALGSQKIDMCVSLCVFYQKCRQNIKVLSQMCRVLSFSRWLNETFSLKTIAFLEGRSFEANVSEFAYLSTRSELFWCYFTGKMTTFCFLLTQCDALIVMESIYCHCWGAKAFRKQVFSITNTRGVR